MSINRCQTQCLVDRREKILALLPLHVVKWNLSEHLFAWICQEFFKSCCTSQSESNKTKCTLVQKRGYGKYNPWTIPKISQATPLQLPSWGAPGYSQNKQPWFYPQQLPLAYFLFSVKRTLLLSVHKYHFWKIQKLSINGTLHSQNNIWYPSLSKVSFPIWHLNAPFNLYRIPSFPSMLERLRETYDVPFSFQHTFSQFSKDLSVKRTPHFQKWKAASHFNQVYT